MIQEVITCHLAGETDFSLLHKPLQPTFPPIQTATAVAYPGILFGGGGSINSIITEDRENGDLGAVAP